MHVHVYVKPILDSEDSIFHACSDCIDQCCIQIPVLVTGLLTLPEQQKYHTVMPNESKTE